MKNIRFNKVLRELKIPLFKAINILEKEGYTFKLTPNSLISMEEYNILKNIIKNNNDLKDNHKIDSLVNKPAFSLNNNLKSTDGRNDRIEFSNDFSEFNEIEYISLSLYLIIPIKTVRNLLLEKLIIKLILFLLIILLLIFLKMKLF